MKLLLVDDHKLFLDGVSQVLKAFFKDAEILNAHQVSQAQTMLNNHLDIDLILVDLSMPEADGISLLNYLCQHPVMIPFAVLSASEDLTHIKKALDLGALGFIPKYYDSKSLVAAIRSMIEGQIYLPVEISKGLQSIAQCNQKKQAIIDRYDITDRQAEVIEMLEKGFTNQEIATALFISEHTVKSHLKQIFQKLAVSNRVACINKAKSIALI